MQRSTAHKQDDDIRREEPRVIGDVKKTLSEATPTVEALTQPGSESHQGKRRLAQSNVGSHQDFWGLAHPGHALCDSEAPVPKRPCEESAAKKTADTVTSAPAAEDPAANAAAERLRSRYAYRFAKRAFDVCFSAAVLVCLSWLFLIVAVAIKVDDPSGPVFFSQERVGRGGRTFRMWKFRSMCADAEERLAGLAAANEKDGPVFKIADDPRITRVGRFIRKTSIDELPQFLNVLAGDMSVVGPRPALPREVALYGPRDRQRLLVRPGLTCYWQTRRNRDSISFDEWVSLDLLYIKQCSAWADLKLIVQTVGVVLTAQGS